MKIRSVLLALFFLSILASCKKDQTNTTNNNNHNNTDSIPHAGFAFPFCSSSGQSTTNFVFTGDSVHFHNTISNPAGTLYFWDFGDGSTSQDSVVVHVFAQINTQQLVKLRVSNAFGSDSTSITFVVRNSYSGTFNFLSVGYGNVGVTNSTGASTGSTFSLPGYPSYSPYYSCSNTTGTAINGNTFVIPLQNILFVDGTPNHNDISATIHGHGYLTGPCSASKMYIVDTVSMSNGTTTIYIDSLARQQY